MSTFPSSIMDADTFVVLTKQGAEKFVAGINEINRNYPTANMSSAEEERLKRDLGSEGFKPTDPKLFQLAFESACGRYLASRFAILPPETE